jgi:hypothetical protein
VSEDKSLGLGGVEPSGAKLWLLDVDGRGGIALCSGPTVTGRIPTEVEVKTSLGLIKAGELMLDGSRILLDRGVR